MSAFYRIRQHAHSGRSNEGGGVWAGGRGNPPGNLFDPSMKKSLVTPTSKTESFSSHSTFGLSPSTHSVSLVGNNTYPPPLPLSPSATTSTTTSPFSTANLNPLPTTMAAIFYNEQFGKRNTVLCRTPTAAADDDKLDIIKPFVPLSYDPLAAVSTNSETTTTNTVELATTTTTTTSATRAPWSDNSLNRTRHSAVLPTAARAAGTALTGTLIFAGFVLTYVAQMVFLALSLPFLDAHRKKCICASMLRFTMATAAIVTNPLWRVTVLKPLDHSQMRRKTKNGSKEDDYPPRVIYVINHLSNADPWVLACAGLPSDTAWIGKASLFSIPFGGWAVNNSGHLRVEFTSEKNGWGVKKGATAKMMSEAKSYLTRGRAMGVYPEGARNLQPEGPVAEFKLGFFQLASDIGATVVPVALSGAEKMWPVSENLFDKGHAFISFGEPIHVNVGECPQELRDKCYFRITAMRDAHPDRSL